MPTAWIKREKSRATLGAILKPSVMTGNATAPPPSLVAPAMNEPNAIVTLMNQFSANRPKRSPRTMPVSHAAHTTAHVTPIATGGVRKRPIPRLVPFRAAPDQVGSGSDESISIIPSFM